MKAFLAFFLSLIAIETDGEVGALLLREH